MDSESVNFARGLDVTVPEQKLKSGTSLYLAGALGFSKITNPFQEAVEELVERMGGVPLNPWRLTPPETIARIVNMPESDDKTRSLKMLRKSIGRTNDAAIRVATGVIACLEGADVDSGTSAEIGAANILGIAVLGYRLDFRNVGELGGVVNAQLEYYVEESRGGMDIVRDIHMLPQAMLKIWG